MVEIVSQAHPVEVVLHIGHLEFEVLEEVAVGRLSDLSQVWLILYEMFQTGERHEAFVEVCTPLPTL